MGPRFKQPFRMHLIRTIADAPAGPRALAIGNFDGVHRGHQEVIRAMRQLAQTHGLVPSVLTFEPHPRRFFAPSAPLFRLETFSHKLHRLREEGVAQVIVPRFDAALAGRSAESFLDDLLKQALNVQALVVGDNFVFGKNRGGTLATLRQWGADEGIHIEAVRALTVEGEVCSSSAIRHAIEAGDMVRASHFLGRPYAIAGRVLHGDGRGRQLGFPTANVALPPPLKLPALGVYAVRVALNGEVFPGVANLGVRPTVDAVARRPSLEVHLLDVEKDLYGVRLEVRFIERLRGEKKFSGLEALTAQIADDAAQARRLLMVGGTS